MNATAFETVRLRAPDQKQVALSDQRFHALLSAAGEFFASFERDVDAEKAAALVDILALMTRYGISLEDLEDQSG
ncbi:MAG: hypothetical protein U1C47_19100 [Hydrogenophaga sp.]|nr:hypothetical protein [Hydrogenophaga sp.]